MVMTGHHFNKFAGKIAVIITNCCELLLSCLEVLVNCVDAQSVMAPSFISISIPQNEGRVDLLS